MLYCVCIYRKHWLVLSKELNLRSPSICREVSGFQAGKKEGEHNILKYPGLGVSGAVRGAHLPQGGHSNPLGSWVPTLLAVRTSGSHSATSHMPHLGSSSADGNDLVSPPARCCVWRQPLRSWVSAAVPEYFVALCPYCQTNWGGRQQ